MDVCWAEEQRWGVRSLCFHSFAPASSATSILLKRKQKLKKKNQRSLLRVLVTKDQILIYLVHQQSKGKGSVRREEKSSRLTYYWISFATILWKNLKFFCVPIHFINQETKNNRWNRVTFHVEFFPTHSHREKYKLIYMVKQLDHILVFLFLIQSWMWCLCLPIWIC